MAEHRNLTGIELHEPKGVALAGAGAVYIADGAGSGVWTSKNADLLNANKFHLTGIIADIGTASSSCFFYIHQKSSITAMASILYGAAATANTILSIYINGVLFADSLTIPFAGSTAGTATLLTTTTGHTIAAGSVVEIRSDGGTSSTVSASVTLLMANVP